MAKELNSVARANCCEENTIYWLVSSGFGADHVRVVCGVMRRVISTIFLGRNLLSLNNHSLYTQGLGTMANGAQVRVLQG